VRDLPIRAGVAGVQLSRRTPSMSAKSAPKSGLLAGKETWRPQKSGKLRS